MEESEKRERKKKRKTQDCAAVFRTGRNHGQKIRLPIGKPVFRKLSRAGASAPFNFFSVFKFEERKNWRNLLQAFVLEFRGADAASVALYILTSAYHTSDNLVRKVAQEVLEADNSELFLLFFFLLLLLNLAAWREECRLDPLEEQMSLPCSKSTSSRTMFPM